MKQFFSLLDGMMEYRQLKEAIEQGRVPVSLTGAAAAHKTHIIASLVYQLQRPALVIVPDESTAIRFAADLNTLLGERVLPPEYLSAGGTDVTQEFVDWCRPLIGPELPHMARLL